MDSILKFLRKICLHIFKLFQTFESLQLNEFQKPTSNKEVHFFQWYLVISEIKSIAHFSPNCLYIRLYHHQNFLYFTPSAWEMGQKNSRSQKAQILNLLVSKVCMFSITEKIICTFTYFHVYVQLVEGGWRTGRLQLHKFKMFWFQMSVNFFVPPTTSFETLNFSPKTVSFHQPPHRDTIKFRTIRSHILL